jgi:hypothetical protein
VHGLAGTGAPWSKAFTPPVIEANAFATIFLNSDIKYRYFYFRGTPNLEETSD